MGTRTESIAATDVTLRQDSPTMECPVKAKRFKAEMNYRIAKTIVDRMLLSGLIDSADQGIIDTNLRVIIQPISSNLLC